MSWNFHEQNDREKSLPGIASGVRGILAGISSSDNAGSVTQHSTDVLSNVVIKLIFWGSQWFRPSTPSAGEILWAIRSIFKSPYMSGLAQYGAANGTLDPESSQAEHVRFNDRCET
jgi:hypothetical protein